MKKADNPFVFYTRLSLLEITGEKAKNLKELADLIEAAPISVVYHHTHHFVSFQPYESPKTPNDFAYWVKKDIHEEALSERIVALDLEKPLNIFDLKSRIVGLIKEHIDSEDFKPFDTPPGREFHFIKAKVFILPTKHVAYDLVQLQQALKEVSIDSICSHMVGIDPIMGESENDFALWLREELGEEQLAERIAAIDPFIFYVMEDIRNKLLGLVKKAVKSAKRSEGGQARC
ncbi:MAG: DUF5752 family protein [Actinomycetota bacterium]|nr:DUF5752 family protein [Actinomycetota bacterium]